jgi:hypothetical protein
MGKTFKRSSSKWDDDDYDFQESNNRKAKKEDLNTDLIENRDYIDDRPD